MESPLRNAAKAARPNSPQVLIIENLSSEVSDTPKPHKASRPILADNMEQITLYPEDPSKTISLGANIEPALKGRLVSVLQSYADVFAWAPEDMLGLKPEVAIHNLHMNPLVKPVKKK